MQFAYARLYLGGRGFSCYNSGTGLDALPELKEMSVLISRSGWAGPLVGWYKKEKRALPWRYTHDPYAIWISEIMLQQTRVEAVVAYYRRFLEAFPTVQALADAPQENVLKVWEGLGYYSRARNLQKAAQTIVYTLSGAFPNTYEALRRLPGVGEYTGGAIASIAFGEAVPAIDGNVKRVASRLLGIRENMNQPTVLRLIRQTLTDAIPAGKASQFNQALMELGATVCIPRAPRCDRCPLRDFCDAYAAGDADGLPVIDRKKPPETVEMAVCLITYKDQILLFKRRERLLHGLYVFGLAENVSAAEDALAEWAERGLRLRFMEDLGPARHVFTHRVWEMRILRFELAEAPEAAFFSEYGALLASREQLKALPLPTAMKAAKQAALGMI